MVPIRSAHPPAPILRILALAGLLLGVASLPAFAWTPPAVGSACAAPRGLGPASFPIAGNYLGGRKLHGGPIDYKSFQSCFADIDRCQRWLAGHAARFPVQPGLASCVAVRVR